MKQTRSIFFTTIRSQFLDILQSKSWGIVFVIFSIIAAHNRVNAETAVPPPVVNTQEIVQKVTKELDKDNGASESEKIIAITDSFLGSGTYPFVSAQELFNKAIQTGNNGYFLLSIQDTEDYTKGHIPGAFNIPFNKLAQKSSLANIPKDRKVVVICYNGHTANAAALFLNQIGYDASPMLMGMSAWNVASPGLGKRKPYAGSAGYAISTESTMPPALRSEVPAVLTGKKALKEIVIARTDAYLSAKQPLEIAPSEVYEKAIKNGDPGYFLLSVQRAEDYSKGHVPGAMNIPYNEIAKKENLEKLPRDKKIVVVCYIGHLAGAVSMFLNQLGYEAYDMRYGTMGWNDTTDGLGPKKPYLPAIVSSMGYPTSAGSK